MTEPKPSLFWRIVRSPLARLLISIAMMGLLAGLGFFVMTKLHLVQMPTHDHPEMSPRASTLPEFWQALCATVTLLVVGRFIEGASYGQLGLPRADAGRQLGLGFGIGALLLSLVVGVMVLAGWASLHPTGGSGLFGTFLWSVLLLLMVAIFEEVFFRGIAFRLLEQCVGSWGATLVTAAFFGFSHRNNPNATWVSSVGIAVEAGVLLAGAYLLYRALWVPIGMHWAWNLFEGPVYGTPVSGTDLPHLLTADVHGPTIWTGGAFGPEAGLLCMVLGGALGLFLMVVAHRRGLIYWPRWMLKLAGRAQPETLPAN